MVKELNQKKTNRNLLTVDQYIQKNHITDAEFNLRVYSNEIEVFASVNSLPVVHYKNIARIEVSPSDFWKTERPDEAMYIYLNDYRHHYLRKLVMAHGLIGLSRSAMHQILTNGSVQLKVNSEASDQEVFVSKYTFKSMFDNPELAISKKVTGAIPSRFDIRQPYLFPDRFLEKVVLEYDPDFSLDEWNSCKIYRNSKFDFLKDLFNPKKNENEYKISSLHEIRVLIPEIFQESGVLGDLMDKSASEYIASYSLEASGRKKYLKDEEIDIAIKLPAPIITKGQLVINESDEDMYELDSGDTATGMEELDNIDYTTEDFESTDLENLLALTKREFWSTYDLDNPSTIPLKKEIIEWLKAEHEISNQSAEAIDLILRGGRSRPGRKLIG